MMEIDCVYSLLVLNDHVVCVLADEVGEVGLQDDHLSETAV